MFTGLIEDTCKISSFTITGEAALLTVETSLPVTEICIGDSIAINGACLTVTAKGTHNLSFDISPESLSKIVRRKFAGGCRVNLERALKMGDRLGGHIVSGHIDCTGELIRSENRSSNYQLYFAIPIKSARYLIEKGSVTIDGISLTVNSVTDNGFSVNIIPHTYKMTTLSDLQIGDKVNIETDIIGKYVERLTIPWKTEGSLSMKTLAENGFI